MVNLKRPARGCPGVPVHEGIPFVFITIHGVMTQFVNVSFFCVPVHEDTTACASRNSKHGVHGIPLVAEFGTDHI